MGTENRVKRQNKKTKDKSKTNATGPCATLRVRRETMKNLERQKSARHAEMLLLSIQRLFYRFVRAADTLDRLNEVKRSETECQATSYRLSANFQHSSVLFT